MPEKIELESYEAFGAKFVVDDPRDFRISALIGAATDDEVELPESYIVPFYRDLFDEDFKPIPSKVREWIRNQYGRPSCVGEATAYQKTAQEGVRMASRDVYALSKTLDGSGDPLSFGTTLNAGQDALVLGVATEASIPQAAADVPLADYVRRLDDPAAEKERGEHKGGSYFRVERPQFRRTLFTTKTPIVSSYMYYTGDRAMASNGGVMGFASGQPVDGHAQTVIGWRKKRDIFFQSWGPDWGDNGVMHVPEEVRVRFGTGRVAVDLPKDLAKLLAKYDGRNIKKAGDPSVFRCELGVLRQYPDEPTYWAFGQTFELDLLEIPAEELDLIPRGIDMAIKDAPYKNRALVREIRQHEGKV